MTLNVKPLWTKDFSLAFCSNLSLFFSFYLLLPVLPFYLVEQLNASDTMTGLVLALYILAALIIRPFSSFLVDSVPRKKLYLICFLFFTAVFCGYLVAASLLLFALLRVLHGFAFGIGTVAGNTLAIDLMPAERRGEGIGYYGMASNIAMAIGPSTGLFLYTGYSFQAVFVVGVISSTIGVIAAAMIGKVHQPEHLPTLGHHEVLSFDRFILVKAIRGALVLFTIGLGYGVMCNYVALYCKQINLDTIAGYYFVIQAMGIVLARIISAKLVNSGQINKVIYIGISLVLVAYILFVISTSQYLILFSAFLMGIGYGYVYPGFQTMFVNLAPHTRRGTANSTYFTAIDLGIGLGTAVGGAMIASYGFIALVLVCMSMIALGTLFYKFVVANHYNNNVIHHS